MIMQPQNIELLDYFAGCALTGLLAKGENGSQTRGAYLMAREMMKEREWINEHQDQLDETDRIFEERRQRILKK